MRAVRRMLPIYVLTICVVLICSVLASQSVTVLTAAFEDSVPGGLSVVVLDPGHGGEDGGAVSVNGVHESSLNLEISLRTRDLLRFLGIPVIMTRETDVSIHNPQAETISEKKLSDLKNRVQIVSGADDALLVSIHQNMFAEAKYYGTQVFYAATDRSQAIAEGLQAMFTSGLDHSNHRQAKPCENVYLLNHISCPGVLVECGFLSNPREEALLQSADYQKKLAAVLAAGLSAAIQIIQSE